MVHIRLLGEGLRDGMNDEGVWDRILKELASIVEHEEVSVDSSTVEAKKERGEVVGYDGFKHRKGSKIHTCVNNDSMPLSIVIGPGNEHDSRRLLELVEGLELRPRKLYADAAYDTESIRKGLESIGIEPNIPVNPRNGRKPRPYSIELYRKIRSAVERFFGWLKSFRRITIRYERLASTYKALVTIASIIIHLRYGILRCVQ
jgi:transposase